MTSRHFLIAALLLVVVATACSDDDSAVSTTSATDPTFPALAASLSDEVREWCTFDDVEDALRWDWIFEEGFQNGLDMDSVNAEARILRAQYEEEGMSETESIRRVSIDLFGMPAFVEACQFAYDYHNPG